MMLKMEKKIKMVAKKRRNLLIPMIINVIIGIILCILSGAQSREINEASSSAVFDSSLGGWERNVCHNKIVGGILSPFAFYFKISVFDANIGMMGCPWRIRNTIYRLLCVCLIVIITLYQIVVLLYRQKSRIWKILYWSQYILYLSMILVLVLDSDGIWNGYHACLNNFDMQTGYGPILLNLMQVQWMTTQSPSWCLGAVGVNVGVVTHQHFGITDGCYLTPFIYTALCDAALIIFTYISYKLARYYSFNGQYDDDDDDEIEESMTYDDYNTKNRRTATINTRRIYGQPTNTTTTISTRGPPPSSYAHASKGGKKATKGRNMKKASISLTEPAHWKTNNKPRRSGKTAPSPAYIVEKSPTYIPHQSIDPEYWQKRKSTYEKNYS